MTGLELFVWGTVGGVAAEAVNFFAVRHLRPSEFPHWVRAPSYYAIAVAMAIIGGVLVLAHYRSGTSLTPILAIHIGAATPLILRKLRDAAPEIPESVNQTRID